MFCPISKRLCDSDTSTLGRARAAAGQGTDPAWQRRRGGDLAAEVATFFNRRAAPYDNAYDSASPDGHALRARMAAALRLVGTGPGEVLDVGMGPGRLCVELARRGWSVSGVDASAEMVARARLRLGAISGRLEQAAAEQLPFADATFDAVTGTGVFEYVHDVPAALAEVSRVLLPGGLAVVSIPNPYAIYAIWRRAAVNPTMRLLRRSAQPRRDARLVTPAQFRSLLATAGLRVDTVRYTSFHLFVEPFGELLPKPAAALAARLEGGTSAALGRLVGTQVVFAARKVVEGPGCRAYC